MKKTALILLLLILHSSFLNAEEGMWIPLLLEKLNIRQMQDMGLKLSAEDIYSVNHSSLKDAIVQFGGGCTAEIISAEGLILTNYHCGIGAIQRHSSLNHDYLANGFWAQSLEEELPSPGITATRLIRIEDVTSQVLCGVEAGMNQLQRNQMIKQNSDVIEAQAMKGTSYEAKVRSFFYGNQYYLIVNEVFRDIRLVGAPSSRIGKFGGDTDNWVWPRHTGDFSIFRIYAGKDNNPADYSKSNVPYQPKAFLPISLKGYHKNDFTFIFGYPGSTREYLSSYAVEQIAFKENPVRIALRQKRLDIINAAMDQDHLVRIQYTAKVNGIANFWKKMIGETKGIKRLKTVDIKKESERIFQKWAEATPERNVAYGSLLGRFEKLYHEYLPVDLSSIYITEGGQSIESVRYASGFRELVRLSKKNTTTPEDLSKAIENLRKASLDFFKNFNSGLDLRVMTVLLKEMNQQMNQQFYPDIFRETEKKFGGNFEAYSRYIFAQSFLVDSARVLRFLDNFKPSGYKKIEKDPLFRLMSSIYSRYEMDILPLTFNFNRQIDSLQRIYMAGQMELDKSRRFYPDANGTLRISYGRINNYQPADAVTYGYYTTLSGVMQKEDSTIYDYGVDQKLKALIDQQDFGPYIDQDSSMHVAFIASNHTTGGNSGSPVLNADGHLIGINFDRNWEGTMSDLNYDPGQCRNISLDIRYCLLIIDKYAGAQRLIREMKIIR